jgi:hypothetical protein
LALSPIETDWEEKVNLKSTYRQGKRTKKEFGKHRSYLEVWRTAVLYVPSGIGGFAAERTAKP